MNRVEELSPSKDENEYILEAYDKDNDVYYEILSTKEIPNAKLHVQLLMKSENEPKTPSDEPINGFVIREKVTHKKICYFDIYTKDWHNCI